MKAMRIVVHHRTWTKDRNHPATPDAGTLAGPDPVLILTPPRGMEVGNSPIATRQELVGAASGPSKQEKTQL